MFGYVIANPELLDNAQKQRYRDCYCGLCHTIGMTCSSASRLSLNYDMAFLVLLLSSLYEPEETNGQNRCIMHPFTPQTYWYNQYTRYCAAMNVALAYYNCMDDWHDDKNIVRLAQAQLFRHTGISLAKTYPRQTAAITGNLAKLAAIEASGIPDPDGAANCFGSLMGELFVVDDADYWAPVLRTVGEGLGRFIYTLDAAIDLDEDLQKGRYNPLSDMAKDGRTLSDFKEELMLLIGEATAAFERLPLVQDAALMRNILYSGVWIKYMHALDKQDAKVIEGGPHDI